MVIDWRSHRYRGGSGWTQAAFVAAYVGLSVSPPPVVPAADAILVIVAASDRQVYVPAVDRAIAVSVDDRSILIPDVRGL